MVSECGVGRVPRDLLPVSTGHEDFGFKRNVCRTVRRRIERRRHWTSWANDGVDVLNSMVSTRPTHGVCGSRLSSSQQFCLADLSHKYCSFPPPNLVDGDPTGALRALCGMSSAYACDRSDLASYTKELVSWPGQGSSAVPLAELLGPRDKKWVGAWQSHLLRDPLDAQRLRRESGVARPHMDPVLAHDPRKLGDFVSELYLRGRVGFKESSRDDPFSLGLFFVYKKDGRPRIIFDTRCVNHEFISPPRTRLCSAGSFSNMDVASGLGHFSGQS